jgi:hypothetical protein
VKPIEIAGGLILLAIVLPAVGCTWVPLTVEGQNVRVLDATDVAGCQKIGTTTAKTADRVVVFARTDRKVHEELASLARNQAAEMGGDALVATGSPAEGRQSFDVYRCESP